MNYHLLLFVIINVAGTIYAAKDFYFGIVDISGSTNSANVQLFGYSNNTDSNNLDVQTISTTLFSAAVSSNFTLDIPVDLIISTHNAGDRTKGIRAQTEDDSLSLVLLISSEHSSDSHLIYPHTALPKPYTNEYIVTTGNVEDSSCINKVLIVSGADDTEVIVYPSKMIKVPSDFQNVNSLIDETIEAGSEWPIILHKFQSLLLSDIGDYVIIKSNQTITVTSAHDCSVLFGVEQMPPTAAWGRIFVIPDFNDTQQVITFVASQRQSSINISGNNIESYTLELDRADVFTAISNSTLYCVSDTPVLVLVTLITNDTRVFSVVPSMEQSPTTLHTRKESCSLLLCVSLSVVNSTNGIFFNGAVIFNWNFVESAKQIAYSNNLKVSKDEQVIIAANSGILLSSISYSISGCVYAHPTAYQLIPLQVLNVSFTQYNYEVLEKEENVSVTVERFEPMNVKTRFKIEISSDVDGQLASMIDVIFDVWEHFKVINITFSDDEFVEQTEELVATILPQQEPINIFPIEKTRIRIMDDDYLNIGLLSITFDTPMLIVSFGITEGMIRISPTLYINISVELTVSSTNLSFDTLLSSLVSKQSIYINLLSFDLSNITDDTVFSTKLILNSKNLSVGINPDSISDRLGNITEASLDPAGYFIFSGFTASSLFITFCIIAVLIVIIVIIVFISVIVCLSFFKYGRKWSVTGSMNRFFLQDDAISLSTNDPDTYELMNKLGELKTDKLTINDDGAYT